MDASHRTIINYTSSSFPELRAEERRRVETAGWDYAVTIAITDGDGIAETASFFFNLIVYCQ